MCAIEPDYSVLMLPYMRYEEAFISHVKDEVQKDMILQLMILEYQNLQLIWMRVLNKKDVFLKLIDKERDFEHLKKYQLLILKVILK